MSTRAGVTATFSIWFVSARIAYDLPTISKRDSMVSRSRAFSSCNDRCWSAFRRRTRIRSVSSGFSRMSYAPSCVASTAVWIVACPLIITTLAAGSI
jgi:hypothetical protein